MYQLQKKRKENAERTTRLIESTTMSERKKDEDLLSILVAKTEEIQKQIDYLLEKIYCN